MKRALRRWPIPPLSEKTGSELAVQHLKRACRPDGVVMAGLGHFRLMWPTDTGKAWEAILQVMGFEYGERVLRVVLEAAKRYGHVPSVIAGPRCAADIPFNRVDNLPWTIHMLYALPQPYRDRVLSDYQEVIEQLVQRWLRWAMDPHLNLVYPELPYDWMDTVRRPSSAYVNHLAAEMLRELVALGILDDPIPYYRTVASIRHYLWIDRFFLDYYGADPYLSADANLYPLYFQLYDEEIRQRCAEALVQSKLLQPPAKLREGAYPRHQVFWYARLTHARYHSLHWPHIGAMLAIGLRVQGFTEAAQQVEASLDTIVNHYHTFVEVLESNGRPFWGTEPALTMFAGSYYLLKVGGKPEVPSAP